MTPQNRPNGAPKVLLVELRERTSARGMLRDLQVVCSLRPSGTASRPYIKNKEGDDDRRYHEPTHERQDAPREAAGADTSGGRRGQPSGRPAPPEAGRGAPGDGPGHRDRPLACSVKKR
jgi:hypothetical protein